MKIRLMPWLKRFWRAQSRSAQFTESMKEDRSNPAFFSGAYYESCVSTVEQLLSKPRLSQILDYDVVKVIRDDEPRVVVARPPHPSPWSELVVLKVFDVSRFGPSKSRELERECQTMIGKASGWSLLLTDVRKEIGPGTQRVILVTPYCYGGSLRDRIDHSQSSIDEAVFHLLAVLLALADLHGADAVHRDVKPSNILIHRELTPWKTLVSDFGMVSAQTTIRTGFAGTISYAAPEQLRGEPAHPAMDMWSWGVVAHELLTGRHPYSDVVSGQPTGGDLSELAEKISALELKLDALEAFMPLWLCAAVMFCLSPEPKRRPTATHLLDVFSNHCVVFRGELQGDSVGAGSGQHQSVVINRSPFLGLCLANRGWPCNGSWPEAVVAVGELAIYEDVRRLFRVGSDAAHAQLIGMVQDRFGPWWVTAPAHDPEGVAHSRPVVPNARAFSEDWFHLQALSLYGSALRRRVEKYAHVADLNQLRGLLTAWVAIGIVPVDLACNVAEALVVIDELALAESVLNSIDESYPDKGAWVRAFHLYCVAKGDVKNALFTAYQWGEAVRGEGENLEWAVTRLWLAMHALELNEPNAAMSSLLDAIEKVPTVQGQLLVLVAAKRMNMQHHQFRWEIVRRDMLYRGDVDPTMLRYLLECCCEYGQKKLAVERALLALSDPVLDLSIYRMHRPFFESLAAETAS